MNASPPPGWYPDPDGEAELRYWDGSAWTQHTSGQAPVQAGAEPTPAAGEPFAPAGADGPGGPGGNGGGPQRALFIGLGVLALAGVVVGVLFLAGVFGDDGGGGGGGGGQDDEEQIQEVVKDFYSAIGQANGDEACDQLTDDAKEQVERDDDQPCEDSVDEGEFTEEQQEQFENIEVKNIEVNGDEATAEAESATETQEIDLEKVDDEWKIADVAGS
jgi:hypothetical protein